VFFNILLFILTIYIRIPLTYYVRFTQGFLPTFPDNDGVEKEETLRRLFARENMRFGSPLSDFQVQLKNGYYRPDIAKMRSLMRKAQFREYK